VVIVVGYSSLILGSIPSRHIEDIDINNNYERLFYKAGFHILEEHYLMFHPEYKKRLQRLFPELSSLEVYRIDTHDYFLNKFNAARKKDVDDIKEMIAKKKVIYDTCAPLFEEWLNHWYQGNAQLREEFEKLWVK
jgi:hypothetical protein